MPRAVKTIKLSEPYEAFGKTYDSIVMKEPSGKMFMDVGPLTAGYRKNGIESEMDNPGVLETYLGLCVTNIDPTSIPVILSDMTLADALLIRSEFAGFFIDAAAKTWRTTLEGLASNTG